MKIPAYTDSIPYLTTKQMIEVDRAMMENAGRNLAHLARERFLDGDPRGKKVMILAGTGGNGGGALVCARHLHNYGAQVNVCITKLDFTPIPAHQLDILRRMKISVALADALDNSIMSDLIVDGIIGYSLKGAPHGTAAHLIRWANKQAVPILSLDAPSGVDTTTGTVYDPAITAVATMTLALPKEGLRIAGVEAKVGELYLANISVPPELYVKPALQLNVGPIFARSDIIRVQ